MRGVFVTRSDEEGGVKKGTGRKGRRDEAEIGSPLKFCDDMAFMQIRDSCTETLERKVFTKNSHKSG